MFAETVVCGPRELFMLAMIGLAILSPVIGIIAYVMWLEKYSLKYWIKQRQARMELLQQAETNIARIEAMRQEESQQP